MKWLLCTLLLTATAASAQELRPFETDGCTMSPDGTPARPGLWRECCVAHDLKFWGGGTEGQRHEADRVLKACVKEKAGATIANIFFAGVRLGSLSPVKLPAKKWGNAWYDRAGYRELPATEIYQLLGELDHLQLPADIREAYRQELQERLSP